MPSASSSVKHAELSQRIIRKDGTVEELGVTSYYHRRLLCRAVFRVEWAARQLRLWLQRRS